MMLEDVPPVFFKPADNRGPACLSVEVNGEKAYRRFWFLQDGTISLDWGWVVAETAVPLVPHIETQKESDGA